jgi:xanthine/uracil permease
VPYIVFGAVFVAIGISLSGFILSNFGYAMELAPNEHRPAFIGMANAVLGVVSFVMVFGGSLLDRRGYETLFATASVAGLVAVFAGGVLTQTHTRPQTTAPAWGLRRART